MILSRADENLLATAAEIWLASGTALDGYDVEAVANGTWAYPLKVAETAIDLRMRWASPVRPEFPVLGNSNLNVVATLQGNDTDSWGAPAVSESFAAPTMAPDRIFTSPSLDLRTRSSHLYWRLVLSGNALPVILGELWLGSTYRAWDSYVVAQPLRVEELDPVVLHRTTAGVELTYSQASRTREWTGAVLAATDADLATLQAVAQANRQAARPFFVDDHDGDARYVRLTAGLAWSPLGGGAWLVELPLREVSRGLPWVGA